MSRSHSASRRVIQNLAWLLAIGPLLHSVYAAQCSHTGASICIEDARIQRPTCSIERHNIKGVVGYFDASPDRLCGVGRYIPAGYYTHINIAFAGVDPNTFQIVGSSGRDLRLWRSMDGLRLDQPSVDIWITLRGRLVSDLDQPTRNTSSDIARSEKNQKLFAKDLIAMMMEYGFDGVDIDWEFPGPEERGGRTGELENFSKWMKNLRAQLENSGTNYQYLQYYDIKKLENPVDWFNLVSYDIRDTEDMLNTWVGPYVHSQNNLTQVKSAMDLLWRNRVDPRKVVMGMTYSGRSLTLADRTCAEVGCMFRSGGKAAKCTATVGFIYNWEIQDITEERGLAPTLYEDAAIKPVSFGDQWVSYEDEDTYKTRGDYARTHCLGGVSVWSISQDDKEFTAAQALTRAIGRKRMDPPNYHEILP
ncbi:glycoside hydrolase superfamily [Aspergillus spectabilis]